MLSSDCTASGHLKLSIWYGKLVGKKKERIIIFSRKVCLTKHVQLQQEILEFPPGATQSTQKTRFSNQQNEYRVKSTKPHTSTTYQIQSNAIAH